MTLGFQVEIGPGAPVYDQVVYAVKKAIVSGRLLPGAAFPSVRTLAQELKINPNTAHKVVMTLVSEGLLEVRPGIGTLVAAPEPASRKARAALLSSEVEHLVVEASRLGVELPEVLAAVERHWSRLTKRK
jgi:GntR family transcriptional regulator